jgi:uncharacterized integral membrane protein
MTWLRVISVLVFVVVFLVWAGQNLENKVTINNFRGNPVTTSPLWMVVLVSVAIGIFFMGIMGIVQEFRDKAEIRKLNGRIVRQSEELSSLRNLSIAEELGEVEKKEKMKEEKLSEEPAPRKKAKAKQ